MVWVEFQKLSWKRLSWAQNAWLATQRFNQIKCREPLWFTAAEDWKGEEGALYFTTSWEEKGIFKLVLKTMNDKSQNSRLQVSPYTP